MLGSATVTAVKENVEQAFSLVDQIFELPRDLLELRPPYPDAWTVSEHLEHLFLANHFLLLTIRKGCHKAVKRAKRQLPPEQDSDLALLAPIAEPGLFSWSPPGHMIPAGQRPRADIRELLREQTHDCLALLEQMPNGEGRLCSIRMSVNNLGRLDMYQWLFFLAQHMRYHLVLCRQRLGLTGR